MRTLLSYVIWNFINGACDDVHDDVLHDDAHDGDLHDVLHGDFHGARGAHDVHDVHYIHNFDNDAKVERQQVYRGSCHD